MLDFVGGWVEEERRFEWGVGGKKKGEHTSLRHSSIRSCSLPAAAASSSPPPPSSFFFPPPPPPREEEAETSWGTSHARTIPPCRPEKRRLLGRGGWVGGWVEEKGV